MGFVNQVRGASWCGLVFGVALLLGAVPASADLTVTPITWDVVGLDHNRPLTSGPELFPVGAEVCSTAAVTNVDVDFVWPDGNGNGWDFGPGHPYINLRPGSLTSLSFASIAAGECVDAYFELQLTRSAAAFGQSRQYLIQATDGAVSGETPSNRAILIEFLVSQNRNTTQQIRYGQQADQSDWVVLGAGGSINLAVNETYFIELTTQTSTGYEELQSFVTLSNTIFQVLSVSTTYSNLTAPPSRVPVPNPRLWADGCLWDSDISSPNYSSCLEDGKAGGVVVTIYEISIISTGGDSVGLEALIYDRSGGSFHYNTDFSQSPGDLNTFDPTDSSLSKRFVPDTIGIGGTSRLRFTISNPNPIEVSGYNFIDNLPAGLEVASPPNASTTCGGIWNPLATDTALAFDGGAIVANGSCTIVVDVTAAVAGTYDNVSQNLFIGTTDTGNNASASLVVSSTPPPVVECDDLATLGLWQFPTGGNAAAPAPTSNLVTVSAAAGGGLTPTIESDTNDVGTGSWSSDFINQGALVLGNNQYFEFVVDTTGIDSITLDFAARRSSQGAQSIQLYYGPVTGTEYAGSVYSLTAANTWFTFGPTTIAANLNPAGNTRFRLYAYNSGQNNNGHAIFIDGVSFRGLFCSPVIPPPPVPGVNPPQISKSFSPDPVGVGQQSTLTFAITNPNPATPLSGITVSDELPSGLTVVPGTFGGSCTGFWDLDPSDSAVMLHSGGALAGGGSCTLTVDVIASTVGTSLNISDLVYATESGYNFDLNTGVAQASLDVLAPPDIAKSFDPGLVLLGVTPGDASTLSFTITNPNQGNAISGVSFSDTFPAGLIVATPPNASTSGCGAPTWSPIAAAGSVSFSGGSIVAGGTCIVNVDVTGPAGTYPNTSGPVSHIVGGLPATNGSTASATVVIDDPIPGLAFVKEVGLSNDPDAAWSDYRAVEPSDSVYYKLTVENTGEVPLTGLSVSDPGLDTSSCTWPDPLPVADATNPPPHIAVCIVGPVAASAGVQTNTASATTTEVPGPTTDTATYATMELSLDKVASPLTYTTAGDIISYTFTVTNTGAAIVPGPVTITDPLVPGATCPSLSTLGNNDNFFDPLEVVVCTGSYTILPSDLTNTSVTNTAVASVAGFDSPPDSATVTYPVPEPTIAKAFATDPIAVGGVSALTITVTNNSAIALTGVGFTDTLPAGLSFAAAVTSSTCGGTATVNGTFDTLTVAGGAVAASGTCSVTIDVNGDVAGNYTNTTSVVSSDQIVGTTTGSDTLGVTISEPTIAKAFVDSLIGVGETTSLTITVTNTAATALSNVGFSDTLPVGLVYAGAPTANTCGGTATVNGTFDTLTLAGGAVAASGTCSVTVDVTGTAAGNYTNTTSVVTSDEVNGTTTGSDTLQVEDLPTIGKVFADPNVATGETTTLTITVTNNATIPLTNASFTDQLPVTAAGELEFVAPVGGTCGGSAVISTTVGTNDTLTVSGFGLAAAASCTVTVDVQANAEGSYTNTTSAVSSTELNGTGTGTNIIDVGDLPTIAKGFAPDPINAGGTSVLTITATNNAPFALTGVSFSDTLPAGLLYSGAPITDTCGGTTTVNGAADTLSVTGGTIAADASCTITINVLGTAGGTFVNTTSVVDSTELTGTTTGSDTLTVAVPEPTIAKAFATDPIAVGGVSALTITVTNNSAIALTGVGFTDTLPAGLTFAAAVTSSTCGGTATVNGTFDTLTVAGGAVAASGTCSVTIDVNGDVAGNYTNTTSVVSSDQIVGTTTGSDTLGVTISEPTIAKAFVDSLIGVGETTSLTITVTNTAATALSNVGFSDTLPVGLVYAGAPTANTCGGTATVNGTFDTLTLAGGAVAASGTCSVTVDVTGTAAGNYTNTTSVVTSDEVNGTTTGSDTLQVEDLPTIGKVFADPNVATGETTTLTITVTNNATIPLTNASFTDQLPVTAAGELEFVAPVGGTCGGSAVISTTVGTNDTLTVSGFGLAAAASCTVTVDVQANAEGSYTNTTSAVSSTELNGTGTGTNIIDVGDLPTIAKGFAPDPINAGGTSVLTITATNNAPFALTGVSFSDTLPAGLLYSGAPITDTCGGTTTVNGAADTLSVTGGTIAADASCTITINVLGTAGGTFVNTTSVVDSTELTGTTTGSDTLTVAVPEPTIAKAFATDPIAVGGVSALTITVTNNSAIALTGVGFTDTLPAGLTFAAAVTSSTCGGTATVNGTFDTLTVAGGAVAASGTCSVTIDVNGDVAGNYTNTTSVVSSDQIVGTTTGSDTLGVTISEPTIAKAFVDSLIGVGETTSLTITVTNTAATALSNVGFSDTLPVGLVYAGAPTANTCGGTATVNGTFDTLTLAGGAVAASGTCSVTVDVTGTAAGNYTNTTSVVTSDEVNGTTTGSDTLQVEDLPTIGKVFADPNVATGETTTLTITVTNNATIPLTNASFTDQLPVTAAGELEFVAPVGGTCGGSAVISTTVGTNDTLTVTGFGLAAAASCTVTVDVQANAEGSYTNTTSAVSSTELNGTGTGTNIIDVGDLPTIAKGFAPDPINAGGTSVLTITATNNAPFALTGVSFSDTLPAGLLYSGAPITDTCGGTTTVNGAADTLSVTGGTIAADASCTITINVLGTAGGTFVNTTSVVDSTELTGTTTGSDTLTVAVPEPTIAKAFATDPIAVGGVSALTITVTNNSAIALTGVGFTDTLPAGLTFAAAVTSSTCGGTATVNGTFDTLTVAGGAVAASGTCSVTIDVNGDVAGNYTNTTSVVSSDQIVGTTTGSDTLGVTISEPTIAKAFVDSLIGVGETTSLTITVTNTAATALSNVGFSDTLPVGLVYAGAPTANTCGGTATVNGTFDTLTLAGGAVAASGTCSVTVDVTGTAAGNYTNTTSVVTSDEVNGTTTGSDTLQVEDLPTIGKVFADPNVATGETTTLTITVTNNATIPLTNASFTDQLPVTAAGELEFVAPVGGTCGGSAVISTTVGTNDTLTVTGFGLAAAASCTVTVDVQANAEGSYTNTTSAVSSTELNGTGTGTNIIDVGDLPTIAKGFAPDPINAGGTSVLTITATNNAPFALTGVSFSDTLPAGLLYSGAPITDTCGGTTTVNGAADTLSVTGGTIAADASCTITINVLGTAGGTFVNTTSVVDSTELTGTTTGSDTLTVAVPEPTIAKAFATDPIAVGGVSALTITVTNNSAIALTGVGFTDTLPAGLTFAAAVTSSTCGGTATVNGTFDTLTLASGTVAASGTCSVTIDVNGDVAGNYTNTTSVVSSDQVVGTTTGSNTLDVVAPNVSATKADALLVDNDGDGVADPGDTLRYTVVVSNTGTTAATNVAFADTPDANTALVVGSVTTSQGAVTVGNTAGDTAVGVDIGTLAASGSVTITFDVTVDSPFPAGTTTVANQGLVTGDGGITVPTDDPDTAPSGDPTVTPVEDPGVEADKTDVLAIDADGDGVPSPGDTLEYTVVITNTGNIDLTGVTFSDTPDANTQLVVGSVTSTQGTVTTGNTAGDASVGVDVGTVSVAATATITFRVTIDNPLPVGVTSVSNQGTLTTNETPDEPTNDPDTVPDDDPTSTTVTAEPVLEADKADALFIDADGNGIPSPGDTLRYTVVITNSGNTAATGVFFTDPIPANTAVVAGSVTTTQGTVTSEDPVGVTIGDLSAGGSVTITFDVLVDNPLPGGVTQVANQGTVSAGNHPDEPTNDPDTAPDDDPTVTPMTAEPVIEADKTDTLLIDADGSGDVSPGDTLSYSVTISNTGNTDATGVVFTDPIPANTTVVAGSVTTSQGTVTTEDPVDVSIGTIGAGSTVTISFHVLIDNPLAAGVTEISNQGTVSSNEVPNEPTNDPDTVPDDDPTNTPVNAAPDLSITKDDGGIATVPGGVIAYTLSYQNTGNQNATGVELTDTVPVGTTFNAGASTAGWVCVPGTGAGSVCTLAIGAVGAGASGSAIFAVTVDNPVPPGFTLVANTATIADDGSNGPDPTPGNNTASDTTPVNAAPNVSATKADALLVDNDGDGVADPGDTLRYTVVVSNTGTTAATNVAFADTPDANTALVVGSVTTSQGAVTVGNTAGDTAVGVDIGTLAASGSVTITFDVTVDSPFPAGTTTVANQGLVTGDGGITVPTDDPDTAPSGDPTVTPVEDPGVEADKTDVLAIDADGDGVPSPGDTLEYTVVITNTGNIDLTGVTFSDTPDANTQLVVGSVTSTQGTVTTGNTAGDASVGVDVGTVSVAATATITFRVTIDNPLPVGVTSVSNQGTLTTNETPDEPTNDPDTVPDDDPTSTTVTAEPVLEADKADALFIDADGNGIPSPGDTLRYTVVITNSGNTAATGVFFTDPIPANTAVVAGSVTTTQGTVTSEDPVGVTIGDLSAGGSVTITFDVLVDNPLPGGVTQVANQGTVSAGNHPDEPTNDPDTAPDDDPTVTPMTAEPVIEADKTDTLLIDADGSGDVSPGDTLSYSVTISNTGNTDATGVVFTDPIPANTTVVAGSVTTSQGTVTTEDPVDVSIGTIGAGSTVTISFHVLIDNPLAAGVTEISNQGTVSSNEVPNEPTNDPDTVPDDDPTNTPVNAAPDLSITKDDGGIATVPGGVIAYTLSYQNTGNQNATGVELTDTVPVGTTFNAGASTAGWVCVPGTGAGSVCTLAIGAVGAGASGSAIFAVTVDNPVPPGFTLVANTATIADDGSNGPDPTPGNNTASDTTPVNGPSNPSLDALKEVEIVSDINGNQLADPGDVLRYTVTVINDGDTLIEYAVLQDDPDPVTTLVVGSVSTTVGTVTVGNGAGDTMVEVVFGDLVVGQTEVVVFDVLVNHNIPSGVTQISNQGIVISDTLPGEPTNDPGTTPDDDPTVIGLGDPTIPIPDLGLLGRLLLILGLAAIGVFVIRQRMF